MQGYLQVRLRTLGIKLSAYGLPLDVRKSQVKSRNCIKYQLRTFLFEFAILAKNLLLYVVGMVVMEKCCNWPEGGTKVPSSFSALRTTDRNIVLILSFINKNEPFIHIDNWRAPLYFRNCSE